MEYMMQNDLLEHIGRKIKFYRVKRKLTVTQLARMVHLSPSAISKYENAKLSIDIRTLFHIAEALDVTVNQLLDYQKSVKQEKYRTNTINFSDEFFICAKSTFLQGSITTGLLSALSQSLRNPYATKVIFSLTPLEQNEKLKEWLRIADKESYSEIKRTNSLVVY